MKKEAGTTNKDAGTAIRDSLIVINEPLIVRRGNGGNDVMDKTEVCILTSLSLVLQGSS
jgi:hypothetical protein